MVDFEKCVEKDRDNFGPCEGELTFGPESYRSQIHDDDTPVWMCEKHREEWMDEV